MYVVVGGVNLQMFIVIALCSSKNEPNWFDCIIQSNLIIELVMD